MCLSFQYLVPFFLLAFNVVYVFPLCGFMFFVCQLPLSPFIFSIYMGIFLACPWVLLTQDPPLVKCFSGKPA